MTTQTEIDPTGPLLQCTEVARLLRISPLTLRRWRKTGRLDAIVLPNGRLRWRRADVDRLLAQPGGHLRWKRADIDKLLAQA